MTSLHATLRDALCYTPDPGRDLLTRIEAGVEAWLADPATTAHAAQAIHSLPSPTAEDYDDWCRAAARAALGALTHHEGMTP